MRKEKIGGVGVLENENFFQIVRRHVIESSNHDTMKCAFGLEVHG